MLEVTRDTDVFTARDEHVGKVDRIIIDALTRDVTHIVVCKGIFFPEDKLISTEDIVTATEERINLGQDVDLDQLQPFIEYHYVPLDEADKAGIAIEDAAFFSSTWYGPYGISSPMYEATMRTVTERNIPDRTTALEAGATVFTKDFQDVGRLEQVLMTDTGVPTHIVIEKGGLISERRAVPMNWIEDIAENAMRLGVNEHTVESIEPLESGELPAQD
ncbi:MAG: PRC-barrel domain-containing protein [Chloroflexota bacterium]|nr:PRC-barrel domain-containing protein [Chloroflexota bacterium]